MDRFKQKFGRNAIFLCAFLIPFLMMQVFWAICGIYPYGPSSILTGDMNIEFVNFYAYLINTLKTNNDWSYMLTKTLGGDFPGLAAFILHDPLIFILLLFPAEHIATGIEIMFSLQISFAGLFASILLNRRYKKSWMSLLFSTAYAFSSFFFGYLVLTIYFGALALLPLVLYFFLKYVDDGEDPVPFIITAALYIYINYHMGFMLVIFLCILYVSRIIAGGFEFKKFAGLFVSGVTVLLIDGFFLIRTGLSLLGEKTTSGADYGFYRRFPMNELFAGSFAGCARNDLRPLIYCSVASLFFSVVFLLSKRFSVREKLADLFVIAAVSVSMWINTIDAVWHGFNNPEGFWWRYAYFISITLVVMGYRGFISIEDNRPILLSALILCVYMAWLTLRGNVYLDRTRLVINLALAAVIAVTSVFIIKGGRSRAAAFSVLFAVSVCEMLYSSRISYLSLNAEGGSLPMMDDFKEDYRNINDVVSYVKEEDAQVYRIEKDFDRGINDPSLFDYIGLSHDSSCEKDEILDWLVNFGFCKTVYFTYYNGGSTSFVDDLFGIKYYISRFDSIEKPYEGMNYSGKYHAYKNANALPLAFAAPEGLRDLDIGKGDTFEKQNLIASYWSERPIYLKAESQMRLSGAEEKENGRFARTGDEGFVIYDIPVTSHMPLYFYFYAPERQNGEVFVNGYSRDVYFTVNHWNVLCAGTYEPGDTVEIKMQIKDDELSITKACFYYEDPEALNIWGEAAKKADEPVGEPEKITSSHFTFTTDFDSSSAVMMSIPYDRMWTVKCDGKKIPASAALGQLMSFDVPAGHHVIDMKYTPEGTVIGIILSALGLLMLCIVFLTKDEHCFGEKLLKRSKMRNLQK